MKTANNLLDYHLDNFNTHELNEGLIGIERESLRMSSHKISQREHSSKLGAALCNRFITTDFSESQLEFICPPLKSSSQSIKFLDSIHKYVYSKIGEEVLWPFSMPPFFDSENEISIAKYGNSNLAEFKMMYREGLALRYGKLMQAISGIHFNFSLPSSVIKKLQKEESLSSREVRDKIYLSGIRNLYRNNWLILYLFGASPLVSRNFENILSEDFLCKQGVYFLPNATSLRMSNLGYSNTSRSELFISLKDINSYLMELIDATNTISEDFKFTGLGNKEKLRQISENLLQIEDEYYSVSRPKSSIDSNIRLASRLAKGGIDYIELRSIDINPFNPSGISKEALDFLSIFNIYCIFSESPNIDGNESEKIRQNDLLVSRQGRDKDLKIQNYDKDENLVDYAKRIFEKLYLINEKIGNDHSSIQHFESLLDDPELTPSAILLNEFLDSDKSIEDLGSSIAHQHKDYFENEISENRVLFDEMIEKEVDRSLIEQSVLESSQSENFETYIENYFKS